MKRLSLLFVAILAVAAGLFTSCDTSETQGTEVTFTMPDSTMDYADTVYVGESYTFEGTATTDVEYSITEMAYFNGATEYTDLAETVSSGSSTHDFSVTLENLEEGTINFNAIAYDSNGGMGEATVTLVVKPEPIKEYSGVSLTYTSTNLDDDNIFNAATGGTLNGNEAAADMDVVFAWNGASNDLLYTLSSPNSGWLESAWFQTSWSSSGKNDTKLMAYSGDYASLDAETISSISVTDGEDVHALATGDLVAFETADGYKGVIKVSAANKVTKGMTIDAKVVQMPSEAK